MRVEFKGQLIMLNCGGGQYLSFLSGAGRGCYVKASRSYTVTTQNTAPTQFVEASGVRCASRCFGAKNGTRVKGTHMPTYVCSAPAGLLDDGRKAAMAEAITRIHSEETGAPTFFVQVVFEEKQPADRFLGGTRASGQIWIRADIRAGRTDAQRQKLMLRIMREVSRITGVREDAVWIYICNLAPTDMI